jgi:hypothetical protein
MMGLVSNNGLAGFEAGHLLWWVANAAPKPAAKEVASIVTVLYA